MDQQKTNRRKNPPIYEQIKKRKTILLKSIIVGLLFPLFWFVWMHTRPANFPIKHIKIAATYEHISKSLLQETVASYVGNGFFYLNAVGLKRQLLMLPWIHEVSIQREWPDTIIVSIIEQTPALQWGTSGLVNSDGAIFVPPSHTIPQNLPIIFGPEEKSMEIFALFQKLQTTFGSIKLKIQKLVLDQQHYWEILLSNGTLIYLKENDPQKQVEFLLGIYDKIMIGHKDPPKSVDLRYNSGLAIKWS